MQGFSLTRGNVIVYASIAIVILLIVYLLTVGGYTVASEDYILKLQKDARREYERAVIAYNIGVIEGYSEALYHSILAIYIAWVKSGNSSIALEILKSSGNGEILSRIRSNIALLEAKRKSPEFTDLIETVGERIQSILNAYDNFTDSVEKGDLRGAERALKDLKYNLDLLEIASGNIAVKR